VDTRPACIRLRELSMSPAMELAADMTEVRYMALTPVMAVSSRTRLNPRIILVRKSMRLLHLWRV